MLFYQVKSVFLQIAAGLFIIILFRYEFTVIGDGERDIANMLPAHHRTSHCRYYAVLATKVFRASPIASQSISHLMFMDAMCHSCRPPIYGDAMRQHILVC